MNSIQNTFSIQDLELLTGVKAHTIRIWEKRYELLNPTRLNRNIRIYSLEDLQKILNVSLLYNQGYKISKISKLSDKELESEVKELLIKKDNLTYYINSIIVSMYSFDDNLFEKIYQQLAATQSFETIFITTFLPVLQHIGVLWQTDSITPAHEHFIAHLIYQKLVLKTAEIKTNTHEIDNNTHILFLPDGEIHELGLLFLNYLLKQKGKQTIYLGRSIPFENLLFLNSQYNNIIWISASVINKPDEHKKNYINQFENLLEHTKNTCWILGHIWTDFEISNKNKQLEFFKGFKDVIDLKLS